MALKYKTVFIKIIYFFIIIQITKCLSIRRRIDDPDDVVDYTGSKVLRVYPETYVQLAYLLYLRDNPYIMFWSYPSKINKAVDILVAPTYIHELYEDFESLGIEASVFIDNVGQKINRDRFRYFSSLESNNVFFNEFRKYDEIRKFLQEKHKANKAITKVVSIGKSVEGRPIVCIGIGVNLNKKDRAVIYIDGGMHAREWASVSTACYIIENLLSEYNAGNSLAKKLLEKYDFYIVPVVNPDGYEYTHNSDRMWRKNRAVIPGSTCIGTDLNRNYEFHWGGKGSSHNPCSDTFAGTKAFSEPESRAISQLILKNKDRMMSYITLHAYGQYFLYPWGWTKDDSPNRNELRRVADIGYKALHSVYQTEYQLGSPSQIMYVSQGSDDWAHGVPRIPYVYTLEMRDKGKNGFLLPKADIIPVGKETYAAVKAIGQALLSTYRVKGTNISKRKRKTKKT